MFIDCNEIIPDRLWVGAHLRPEHLSQLRMMGITTVLNFQTDEDIVHYAVPLRKLEMVFEKAGIEQRRIPVMDFNKEALSEQLPRCVSELEAALKPLSARVYVHCTIGVNRAPTVAAAFLLRSRKMTPREAFEYVSSRRHCSPYLDLLEQYASSLSA